MALLESHYRQRSHWVDCLAVLFSGREESYPGCANGLLLWLMLASVFFKGLFQTMGAPYDLHYTLVYNGSNCCINFFTDTPFDHEGSDEGIAVTVFRPATTNITLCLLQEVSLPHPTTLEL